MNAQIKLWPVMTALLLAACASAPPGEQRAVESTGMPALAELPTHQLARGQCALVLWSPPEIGRRTVRRDGSARSS